MRTLPLTLLGLHLGLAVVAAQPVITIPPQSQTNFVGTTAVFAVAATGTEPLSYQWRSYLSSSSSSYTNIPFGTETALVLKNIQSTTRRLAVVVTDGGGLSVTSSPPAQLTAVARVALTPVDPAVNLFTDVTLRAAAGSVGLVGYEWLFNGVSIAGAVSNRLALTNIQQAAAGGYSVIAHHNFGSSTSQVSTLTVTTFAITPANPTASLFADLTLALTNKLSSPVSYQWFFEREPIPGAVTNRLVVTNVQKTNAGNYTVVFTNSFGSFTSQVATLKITPFNSMYFFGDSWTDTGGNGCIWPSPDYYGNRACNGPMWPEYLAASLGLTYSNSAYNVAHCGDVSAEILAQVSNQLRPQRSPRLALYASMVPGLDLAVMWPGGYRGVYVDPTNQTEVTRIIDGAVQNVSKTVQILYARGARAFLYLPQGGTNASDVATFGSYRAGLVDAYSRSYNMKFGAAMDAIKQSHADVRICVMDLYSLYDAVSQHPGDYGFTDSFTPGLSEPNKAFDGPGATHLFWDGAHATTKFHSLMAAWDLDALRTNVFEEIVISGTAAGANIEMNHLLIGRDYTLQRSGDLNRWEEIQTFTAAAGTNRLGVALEARPSTFYRLRWNP